MYVCQFRFPGNAFVVTVRCLQTSSRQVAQVKDEQIPPSLTDAGVGDFWPTVRSSLGYDVSSARLSVCNAFIVIKQYVVGGRP